MYIDLETALLIVGAWKDILVFIQFMAIELKIPPNYNSIL